MNILEPCCHPRTRISNPDEKTFGKVANVSTKICAHRILNLHMSLGRGKRSSSAKEDFEEQKIHDVITQLKEDLSTINKTDVNLIVTPDIYQFDSAIDNYDETANIIWAVAGICVVIIVSVLIFFKLKK